MNKFVILKSNNAEEIMNCQPKLSEAYTKKKSKTPSEKVENVRNIEKNE